MHQRRRLKRMSRLFPGHFLRGQTSQFSVNEGKQFIRRTRVIMLEAFENARDVAQRIQS